MTGYYCFLLTVHLHNQCKYPYSLYKPARIFLCKTWYNMAPILRYYIHVHCRSTVQLQDNNKHRLNAYLLTARYIANKLILFYEFIPKWSLMGDCNMKDTFHAMFCKGQNFFCTSVSTRGVCAAEVGHSLLSSVYTLLLLFSLSVKQSFDTRTPMLRFAAKELCGCQIALSCRYQTRHYW